MVKSIVIPPIPPPNSLPSGRILFALQVDHLLVLQVAKSVKIVLTSRLALIVVSLDMEGIQASHLSIDSNIVRESILRNRRIKLKQQVGKSHEFKTYLLFLCLVISQLDVNLQHIKVLDAGKLEVHPQGDRSTIHFELHALKNLLPAVVVKVRVCRIFIFLPIFPSIG